MGVVQKLHGLLTPLDAFIEARGEASRRQIGGKAAGLAWLARQGFAVPDAWVIEASALRRFAARHLPDACQPARLLEAASGRLPLEAVARGRELLLSSPMESPLRGALADLWTAVQDQVPWGLAVRSSATCEDSELTSMAGLAASEIGVRGVDPLVEAVQRVWASALLPRALEHLSRCGVRDLAMAVVVQKVVPAAASGVLFTSPPPGTGPAV